MAGVRICYRRNTIAQRGRVKFTGVCALLLQQLSIHVLSRLINLHATLLSQLTFALLPRRAVLGPLGGAGLALGRAGAAAPGSAAVLHAAAAAVVPELGRLGFDIHLHFQAVTFPTTGENPSVSSEGGTNSCYFPTHIPLTFTVYLVRGNF